MPQGIDTPGVEKLPQGDKTSGVPTKGDGMQGKDRRGRGGDINPPTTRATEARGAIGGNKGMTHGPGKAALPSPQWGTATDGDSAGTLHRHSDGTDSARPKNDMQSRRKCALLAPEEPAGDPAATGTQVRGGGHRSARGADDQGWGDGYGKQDQAARAPSMQNARGRQWRTETPQTSASA